MSEYKPECNLSDENGNVFNIIACVSRALKRADLKEQATEFQQKAMAAKSYDEVLRMCFDYVEVT